MVGAFVVVLSCCIRLSCSRRSSSISASMSLLLSTSIVLRVMCSIRSTSYCLSSSEWWNTSLSSYSFTCNRGTAPYRAVKTRMVAKEGNTDEWANMVFIETHFVLCTNDSRPHMELENYVYLRCIFFFNYVLLNTSKFKYSAQHLCQESVSTCAPPKTNQYPWTVYVNHPIPVGT